MLSLILYFKDHRRRPVRLGHHPCFRDTQADIPAGWCRLCGSEVYEPGKDRCIRCRHTKGENR